MSRILLLSLLVSGCTITGHEETIVYCLGVCLMAHHATEISKGVEIGDIRDDSREGE